MAFDSVKFMAELQKCLPQAMVRENPYTREERIDAINAYYDLNPLQKPVSGLTWQAHEYDPRISKNKLYGQEYERGEREGREPIQETEDYMMEQYQDAN